MKHRTSPPRHLFRFGCLFLIIFGLAVLCYCHFNDFDTNDQRFIEFSDLSCETVKQMANKTKWCMLHYANNDRTNGWLWLMQAMIGCSKDFRNEIAVFGLNDTIETNHTFLKLKKQSYPCNVFTLGIGDTIATEKLIKILMPRCKFYGVDAVYQSGLIYNHIGRFYPVAIGNERGFFESKILINDKNNQLIKDKRIFYYLTLVEILETINLKFVDYLLINIDGLEYDIFKSLQFVELQLNKIRICQINVEFHSPLRNYDITNEYVTEMMENFLNNTPYVPLKFDHEDNFRMLLVDLENDECIEKYFQHCNI